MIRTANDGDPIEAPSEEPADSLRERMAMLRPLDASAPLARARVLGALFGEHHKFDVLGRFQVINRLGAGGMGVVYEAYDPDLARGVALKLVTVTGRDRQAALAEAQALAKLSHPNVVPIYDVGLDGDHVYLVMELVRGQTLRAWSKDRSVREILGVYHQAGLALASAHGVGLIHRDFKPENALVGSDGRVRVVDFGLACEADEPGRDLTVPRPAAGTPRFMAPEITSGAAITPAADQYSFCVALADALEGSRQPVPRRISVVIERGRAAEAAKRFASMNDLLRALARDPVRTWRRVAVVGGVAAAVGMLTFFLGRSAQSDAEDPCDGGAAALEAAWSSAARAAALARVAALGPYGQSLGALLERGLDAHRSGWLREYRAACIDHRRGIESDTLSDRRALCLKRGTDALAAVGDMISRAEPAGLVDLPRAVQSLADPAACSDRDALTSDIALPPPAIAAQIAQVRSKIVQAGIEVAAGRYAHGFATAQTAAEEVRALSYEPALAEALLVQGRAQMELVRSKAVPILAEAVTVAMVSHADALVVEAWARRAYAQGTSTDPAGALSGLDVIEPLARRTASAGFARALLYNNLGSVELAMEHRAAARAYLLRALAESRTVTGPGALELVFIRYNLALVTDDRQAADRLLVDVAAELDQRLGPEHPDALVVQQQRALTTIEDLRETERILTPVCRAYELHALSSYIARSWTELGLVRWDLGDRAGALAAMSRAVVDPVESPEAAPYVALLRGDGRAAVRQFEDAVAQKPPHAGEPWWDRMARANLTLGLGRARREVGDLRGAREALDRAIAVLGPLAETHRVTSYERRLGRAQAELALTLADTGGRETDRRAAAAAAAAWLRRVGGAPAEIDRLSR